MRHRIWTTVPSLLAALLASAPASTRAEPVLDIDELRARATELERAAHLCVCQEAGGRAGRVGILARRRTLVSELPQMACALPTGIDAVDRVDCLPFTLLPARARD